MIATQLPLPGMEHMIEIPWVNDETVGKLLPFDWYRKMQRERWVDRNWTALHEAIEEINMPQWADDAEYAYQQMQRGRHDNV